MRLRSSAVWIRRSAGLTWTAVDVDGVDNYAYGLDTDGTRLSSASHTSAATRGSCG